MAVNTVVSPNQSPFATLQYLRKFSLLVSGSNFKISGNSNTFNGIDLSNLQCKFTIKRSSNQTPNCADIIVYNVDDDTAVAIQKQFTQVLIQGGYESNFGVVFRGNLKQAIIGRESQLDTFLNLNCGDGDLAYNYAVVNQSVKAGASQTDVLNQISAPMAAMGTTTPTTGQPQFMTQKLPRGKVMYGNAKDHMRKFARTNGLTWSIQNGKVQFIHQQGYAPGQTVVLNSKTGMIGTPQQTNIGINVKCLMNPNINPGQTIKINNAEVAALKIDLGNPKDPVNLAPPLNADGVYYVLVHEIEGDTRGEDWHSNLICCAVKPAAIGINSIDVSYGP